MAGIQLNAQRIRFAVDASKPFAAVNDAITGQALAIPSGSALQLELIFSFGQLLDANLLDLSVYSAINIQLQANADPHNGAVYYAGQVLAASFAACNSAQWTAVQPNTNAQISLVIPSAQNVVPPGSTNYWLCVYGVSTDPAQDNVLLFAASIVAKDSGVPTAAIVLVPAVKLGAQLPFICLPANGGDGLTRNVSLVLGPQGRYTLAVDQVGSNAAGQAKYAFLCTPGDGLYRDVFLINQGGDYILAIDQAGHS